ncbi:hypothetical protein M1328_02235 [Patescibacteria group bacterium]|nr:hypothetical protein [Patescibacteria group bacterium]
MIKKILFIFFIAVIAYLIFLVVNRPRVQKTYLVTGHGNPGDINVYEIQGSSYKKIRTINTGYKFVYAVRLGDIYNNGQQSIIAGVSNSFFAQPYGCKIIAYDLKNYKKSIIDDVGDLRCKDLTIGDVENTGTNDIVLATHGEGFVNIYSWNNGKWSKQNIETNFIKQVDDKERTNHRVSNSELTCQLCVVQTAVHIVKIGDVDNDGKNEILASMSSPLELQGTNEISFLRMYKKVNGIWKGMTIDRLSGREFRSITIGDIYHTGSNTLIVGIGSPRGLPASLFSYTYKNGSWEKSTIYNDPQETNMKGVVLVDPNHTGKQQILLATGFPQAKIFLINWDGEKFIYNQLGTVASLFPKIKDGQFNSMVALANAEENNVNFYIGGMITFPKQNIGWEGTNKGFLVKYIQKNNGWKTVIIDKSSILGMDIGF